MLKRKSNLLDTKECHKCGGMASLRSQRSPDLKEATRQRLWDRALQAGGTASAKALKRECLWGNWKGVVCEAAAQRSRACMVVQVEWEREARVRLGRAVCTTVRDWILCYVQ